MAFFEASPIDSSQDNAYKCFLRGLAMPYLSWLDFLLEIWHVLFQNIARKTCCISKSSDDFSHIKI